MAIPAEIDSESVAAFQLGFYSRYFESDALSEALAVLCEITPPPIDSGLRHALSSPSVPHGIVTSLADRAIDPTDEHRPLYDLGAALGDYLHERVASATTPDVRRVWDCVQQFPNHIAKNVGFLCQLAREAGDKQDIEAAMKRVVGPVPKRCYNPKNFRGLPPSSRKALLEEGKPLPLAVRFAMQIRQDLAAVVRAGRVGNHRKSQETTLSVNKATATWRTGHFGLQFDDGKHVVRGEGIEVELSPLNWNLLNMFHSFGDRPASRKALKPVWKKSGLAEDPDDVRVDDALTDFRKAIKPLGLRTKVFRKLGWTLVTAKSTPAPPAQRSRKKTTRKKRK